MAGTQARKRRSGIVASYLYTLGQLVVALINVPLLLGGIGQGEYGLYQMTGSLVAYLSVINVTLSAGAVRFYCKYYALGDEVGMANTLGTLRRIYRVAYVVVVALALALMAVTGVIYRDSLTPWEVQESCLMLGVLALNLMLTMGNTVSIACITAHEEFAFAKLSSLVGLVLQPALVVVLMRWWPNALMVTVVQLACNLLVVAAQRIFARRRLHMDDRLRFVDRTLERQVLAFSGSIVLASVADMVFWRTDQLILGYLYGSALVAIYAVGAQTVSFYMPLGTAVSSVFMPRVSELWHRDHDRAAISRLFVQVSRITVYPLLVVLLGFVVLGQDFVRLWAGDGFGAAWWVTVLELTPLTIDVAQSIGITILQVMGRYGFRARMYLAAAVANVALTIVLARHMGIVGAALATGIAVLASSGIVLNWYYDRRIGLDMRAWWKSVGREAIPLLALCAAARVAWQPFSGCGWGTLVAGIAVWAAAYAAVAYLASANAYERGLIKGFVRKLLHRG